MDSARMLQQQLALKDLVIQAFIPPPEVQKVTARPPLVGGFDAGSFPVHRCSCRRFAAPGHPGSCSATRCAEGG